MYGGEILPGSIARCESPCRKQDGDGAPAFHHRAPWYVEITARDVSSKTRRSVLSRFDGAQATPTKQACVEESCSWGGWGRGEGVSFDGRTVEPPWAWGCPEWGFELFFAISVAFVRCLLTTAGYQGFSESAGFDRTAHPPIIGRCTKPRKISGY